MKGTLLMFGVFKEGEETIIPNVTLEDAPTRAMKWDVGRLKDNGNSHGNRHVWTVRAYWSPHTIVSVGNRTGWLGTPDAWTADGETIRWIADAIEIRRPQ